MDLQAKLQPLSAGTYPCKARSRDFFPISRELDLHKILLKNNSKLEVAFNRQHESLKRLSEIIILFYIFQIPSKAKLNSLFIPISSK